MLTALAIPAAAKGGSSPAMRDITTMELVRDMGIGINLGKCMPIVIGLMGSDKKAKKVSWSYLLFNIFGAVFFMALIYSLHGIFGLSWMSDSVNRGSVATVHLFFNLFTSIILLLGTDRMTKICDRLGGVEEQSEQSMELAKLDDMLLNTPTIALEQCKELIGKMTEAIRTNYKIATDMIYKYDASKFPELEENEEFLDKCETVLSSYIVRIDQRRLMVITVSISPIRPGKRMKTTSISHPMDTGRWIPSSVRWIIPWKPASQHSRMMMSLLPSV